MFKEEYEAISNAAVAKVKKQKSDPLGFFMLAILAGMFIGFGVLLTNSIGGQLDGAPATKIVMGLSFGVALSLVVAAGAELFTGNNLVLSAGIFKKKVTVSDAIVFWIICWIGNLVGGIILGIVYHGTGLDSGAVGEFFISGANTKATLGILPLITRGILCNILVCLATWCATKLKSDAGKLIIIFWCLYAFITSGFEHSIANMTLFTVVLLNPENTVVTLGGAAYNLLFVTIGNMIGGILFVSVPYFLGAREK